MLNAYHLSAMISDVFHLHSNFAKTPEKASRKFDGKTPYGVHPTLAAMLLLHEETLPEDFRVLGAQVLLGHDLIEDTTASLQGWCKEPDVESLIRELTFAENQDSSVEIFNRSAVAILLKFYDAVVNLMCTGKMDPKRREERRARAMEHLIWVETRHPELEIVKIAHGLLD